MSFLVGQSALRRNTHVGLVRQLDSHNSHFKRNEDFYYCSVHNSLFFQYLFFCFVHTTNKINIFFLSVISAAAKSRLMFANRLFRASLSHLAFCWMSLITLAFRKSACSGKETKERVRESRWRRRKKIGVAQLSVVQRGDRSMLRRRRKERKNIFLSLLLSSS